MAWNILSVIVLFGFEEAVGISSQAVYDVEVAKASKALSDTIVTRVVIEAILDKMQEFRKSRLTPPLQFST